MQWTLLADDDLTATASSYWDQFVVFLSERGISLGLNLLAALAIFVVGRWAAGMLTRLCKRLLTRSKVDDTLSTFLGHIVYAMLLTFVIIAAIDRLGVNTTSFAAIVGAAGLAVGLALQNSLSNFASGVMLILFKPFKVGDYVEAGGTAGIVEEINIFNTFMRTGDNIRIVVPNGQITSATITNYNAKPTRRIDLVIGCGYDDDLRAVKSFLMETLSEDSRILDEPAPVVAVNELGSSSVNFVVRPWVNAGDYWNARWDLIEKIKLGFDDRGFHIPYPTQDVHVHTASA